MTQESKPYTIEAGSASLSVTGQSSMMAAYMPRDTEAAYKLAVRMANTAMVPNDLRGKGDDVFAIFARAASVGIDWSNALHSMHVVHGRVGFSANLIAAICDTSPAFEVFDVLESTETSCTVEAKKRAWEKPRRYTVTIEGARQAGFNSDRWKKQPRVMLQNMCKREAGRLWNPAGLMGMYEAEELEVIHLEAADVTPIEPDPSRRVQHGEEAPVVQQAKESKVDALLRDKAREGAATAGEEAVEALVDTPEGDEVKKKAAELAEKRKVAAEKRKATIARKKAEKEAAAVLLAAATSGPNPTAELEEEAMAAAGDAEVDLDFNPPWEKDDDEAEVGPITSSEVKVLIGTMRKFVKGQTTDDGKAAARVVWEEFLTYVKSTFKIENHTQIPANRFDVALETLEVMIEEAETADA